MGILPHGRPNFGGESIYFTFASLSGQTRPDSQDILTTYRLLIFIETQNWNMHWTSTSSSSATWPQAQITQFKSLAAVWSDDWVLWLHLLCSDKAFVVSIPPGFDYNITAGSLNSFIWRGYKNWLPEIIKGLKQWMEFGQTKLYLIVCIVLMPHVWPRTPHLPPELPGHPLLSV